MVRTRFLIQAELLISRIKDRLNYDSGAGIEDPTELEIEGLYNWVISRLHSSQENTVPTLKNYWVRCVMEEKNGKWVLSHGKEAYEPKYVEKEQFYIIMEKVATIFNYMDKFSAMYTPPEKVGEGETTEMIVQDATIDVYVEI